MTKTKVILEALKNEPMTLKQLAEVLGVDADQASTMVMYMQRRKYLVSVAAPVLYTLSEEGNRRRLHVPKTPEKRLKAVNERKKAKRRLAGAIAGSAVASRPLLATVWAQA